MKILFDCPYADCSGEGKYQRGEGSAHIDLNSPRVKMVTCGEDGGGGCGRHFIVWVEDVAYEKKAQKIDCEVIQ